MSEHTGNDRRLIERKDHLFTAKAGDTKVKLQAVRWTMRCDAMLSDDDPRRKRVILERGTTSVRSGQVGDLVRCYYYGADQRDRFLQVKAGLVPPA